jgi:hypothetical protein
MPRYMLFLHSDRKDFRDMSPEDIQKIILRYKTWREGMATKGYKPEGQKLQDGTGRVMTQTGGNLIVTDGPYAETREILGGYFAFDAESFEKAVELASDCPHLQFGTIEIREVELH